MNDDNQFNPYLFKIFNTNNQCIRVRVRKEGCGVTWKLKEWGEEDDRRREATT